MEFTKLREKFDSISYDSFSFREKENDYEINYFYTLGEYSFTHKINILKKHFTKVPHEKERNVFLFNLGLAELISYYKCACPKKVILKAGFLTDEQKEFWKKLFYFGLGEFRFINNIDIEIDEFVEFENATKLQHPKSQESDVSGNLVPIGGGKDSIVTIELLKK